MEDMQQVLKGNVNGENILTIISNILGNFSIIVALKQKPSVKTEIKDQRVSVGDTAKFECEFTANPVPGKNIFSKSDNPNNEFPKRIPQNNNS